MMLIIDVRFECNNSSFGCWNTVCLCGYVLRTEDVHVLRQVFELETDGQRKNGKPKRTWERLVEEESMNLGLIREDVLCQSKWNVGINQIATRLRQVWLPSFVGDTT